MMRNKKRPCRARRQGRWVESQIRREDASGLLSLLSLGDGVPTIGVRRGAAGFAVETFAAVVLTRPWRAGWL